MAFSELYTPGINTNHLVPIKSQTGALPAQGSHLLLLLLAAEK